MLAMILNETISMIFKHRDNFSFCSMLYNKKICIVCKVMSSLQSRDSLKGERSIILTPSIFVNEFNTCKFKSRLSQCLKITWKVAFNIASEASYVYILRGQCYQTGQFLCDKYWRYFYWFSNTVGKVAMNGLVLLSITIRIQCCLIGFIDGTRTKPELCWRRKAS